MSKFLVTYWTQECIEFQATSIRNAAHKAGYDDDYQKDYAFFWKGKLIVVNEYGDQCAKIERV